MSKRPTILHGAKVIDAKTPLVLNIRKSDITGATPRDPQRCAAARCINRTYHTKAVVMRAITYVQIKVEGKPAHVWMRYMTPPSLAREIVALDRGGRVEEGDFCLTPAPPGRRLGQKLWRTRGQATDHNRRPKHFTTNIREA